MSIPLSAIDLTSAVVGTTGVINLQNIQPSASPKKTNQPDRLYFYNESGCGLLCNWGQSQSGFRLPAGAWKVVPVIPGETVLNYIVEYVIPNASVSKLLAEYFDANEDLPQLILGNSPVGGGTVTTSFQAKELVTNDLTEGVFPDNTSFANQITFIPIFLPSGSGTINIGMAALNGSSDFLIWSSDVLNNIMKIAMHLQFALGTMTIAGAQIYTATIISGGQITLTHGLGVVPQIVITSDTNSATATGAGSYTTTTVIIFGTNGQTIKVLVFV